MLGPMLHMKAKVFCSAIVALTFAATSVDASSEEKPEVIWGGVAISSFGKAAMAPVAEALLNCSNPSSTGVCPIEEMAKRLVLDAKFEKISVTNDYAEDRVNYLISVVIDAEKVSSVVLGKGDEPFVYQFLILGSLVVYEVTPQETTLLSSVPISVYADRYYQSDLSIKQQSEVIQGMYLELESYKGNVGYYNFFHNLVEDAVPIIDRPLKFGSGVKFTNVGFNDDVAATLSTSNNLEKLSNLFAVWATATLAEATRQPIIPATLGANDLKLVFRDAETLLLLPEPLYEFDMYVQAVDTYQNASYTCFDVAAYYGVKVFGEIVLDAPIQHGEDSCAFLESGSAEPDEIYPANLLAQIQQVMFGFSSLSSDRQYIKSHIVQDRDMVLSGFRKIREEVFSEN